VATAIEIQVSDTSEERTLDDAERCLLRALELNPKSIEALQELAHFYYAVFDQPVKAQAYATRCKEMAIKLTGEMDEILADSN